MDIQKFFFKLAIMFLNTLKFTVVFAPLVMAIRALKGGEFEWANELPAALFISLGLGMALTVWNAMEFENYKRIPLNQYLKAKQHTTVELADGYTSKSALDKIKEEISLNKNWKLLSDDTNALKIEAISPYRFKDIIAVSAPTSHTVQIQSKPRTPFWLIDLGRNYTNNLQVLRVIKQLTQD